jgi:hypothetical protein
MYRRLGMAEAAAADGLQAQTLRSGVGAPPIR